MQWYVFISWRVTKRLRGSTSGVLLAVVWRNANVFRTYVRGYSFTEIAMLFASRLETVNALNNNDAE
jgi:hypothetical protein